MYLAIYKSVDSNVAFGQTATAEVAMPATSILAPATALVQESTAALLAWVGNLVPRPTLPGAPIY